MGLGAFRQLGERLTSALSGAKALGSVAAPVATKGPSPIALDFGARSLKALQISTEGQAPSLIAAACVETPATPVMEPRKRLEYQLQQLPRLVREGGFRGRRVVCAIPRWMTLCKSLQVPRQDGVAISSLVESAMAVQLGLDPALWVHRCTEVLGTSATSGKAEVIVMAVQREQVEKLMMGMAGAKLEPVGMQSAFAATLRAFDYVHAGAGDATQNTLYLDIGSAGTNVMIAHGRDLAFARVMELGGDHLDDLVVRQLKVDLIEARRLRLAAETVCTVSPRVAVGAAAGFSGDVNAGPAAPLAPDKVDLAELLEGFTDEVKICLRYHASQFPGKKVDRAVFVGGESRHRGLCQHVAKALRLPAQMADPLARLARSGKEPASGVDLREPQPGWAVAMGLCLSPTDF